MESSQSSGKTLAELQKESPNPRKVFPLSIGSIDRIESSVGWGVTNKRLADSEAAEDNNNNNVAPNLKISRF